MHGSELEEGDSQGLPVWSRHVGNPILARTIRRNSRSQPPGMFAGTQNILFSRGAGRDTNDEAAAHSGGSRAAAVTSDRHAARLVFQSASEPSADSVLPADDELHMAAGHRTTSSVPPGA